MKRDFPGLEFADQFLGSIDRDLIADGKQYPAVALDRIVDFRTFITHHDRRSSGGSNETTCSVIYDGGSILFQGKLRTPRFRPSDLPNPLHGLDAEAGHQFLAEHAYSYEKCSSSRPRSQTSMARM
jgi:hypothetical protein